MCKMAVVFDIGLFHLLIFMYISSGICYKLNVPKILLPYQATRPINFTLQATEGCFTWRSTKPEVASVQALGDEQCSKMASVTALSMHPSRKTAIILAEEQGSGHIVRCDVIVDTIYSIHVETTTRVLYLDEPPEEIVVRGQDDEGNVFSSLQGLEFEWSLISDYEGAEFLEANNVLRMVSFLETYYIPLPHIAEFETGGKQGDRILIEGITTGSAKVSVKLKARGFKSANASVVRLIVTDNLMLNPSHDVYILVHSQVQYQVEKFRQGKFTVLTMPSLQYRLELANTKIASLDEKTLKVTALQLGTTEVILIDKNVKDPISQPSAGIHVVEPKFLGFVVLPGRNYVLQLGNYYEILVEIYDRNSNKIFPSDNIRMEAVFPVEYFKVLYSSHNGTYHRVQTLKNGMAEIAATLIAVSLPDGSVQKLKIPVVGKQEVNIYKPLVVSPPELVFPWQPRSAQSHYQYKLKATGGTGNHTWSSSDKLVANVNVHGMVTTATMLGETTVTAADVRNSAHTGSSKVYVLRPIEMLFLDSKVEAELGSTLALPLAIYAQTIKGGEKKKCTDCKLLPLEKQLSDNTVFKIVEDEDTEVTESACTMLFLRAESIGHSRLTVTYQQGDTKLQATVTIAAYVPLNVLDPSDVAVVSLGSSKRLVLSGGPQPWVLDPSKYYRNLVPEKPNAVSSNHVKSVRVNKNYHYFEVTCLEFCEQTFTVTVGNNPATKNQYPAVAKTTVQFACAPPATLHLRPQITQPTQDPPCPLTLDSSNQIPVQMSGKLEILVFAADSLGRQFDNFTSLVITWESTNTQFSITATPQTVYTDIDGEVLGSKVLKAYQMAVLMARPGSVTLTATTNSYSATLFKKLGIKQKERIEPPLSDFLSFLLVKEVTFDPIDVTIFNHPSNKAMLKITGGSGHFLIKESAKDITSIKYDDKKRIVEVSPQNDGIQTVTVQDLCIEMTRQTSARVQVAGIDSIELSVVDKVQVEHEVMAKVHVLDASNNPLVASVSELVGLKLTAGSEIVSIRPFIHTSSDPNVSQFVIHGRNLGSTNLVASASIHDRQINSKVKTIQVFPPLRLNPRNITLLVGSLFQVRSTGGPQPQSLVEFSIGQQRIASISSSGIVEALNLGHTRVTGKAVGSDENGGSVVYSEDYVDVSVISLEDVRISAPLLRLQTQSEMPVYATGLSDSESPFTLGSTTPPLLFEWSVSNEDVITVEPVFAQSGVYYKAQHNVAMRVRTRNAGEALLRLRVSQSPGAFNQISNNAVLVDEVQIQVFEKLSLTHPTNCDSTFLMTPNTNGLIKTNRDGSATISYSILGDQASSIVTVNHQGVVTSSDALGQVSVLVVAHERFGLNQSTIVLVKVKPVLYVYINCDTKLTTTDKKLHVFPVGLNLEFSTSFYDNVGAKFDSTNINVEHRLNRYDLLQLQPGVVNISFVARVAHQGSSLFKVWDQRNPRIEDYASVAVGSIITSEQPVTFGDVLKFTTPLLTGEGQRGTWSSSDPSVLRINSDGVAIATGPGTSTLELNLADGFVTQGQVTVKEIERVSLDLSNLPVLSNVQQDSPIEVNVDFGNTNNDVDSDIIKQVAGLVQPMFKCSLHPVRPNTPELALFNVYPAFNTVTGKYYCGIRQISDQAVRFKSKSETQFNLKVTVDSQRRQKTVQSTPVTLTFLPGFQVHSPQNSKLTSKNRNIELLVSGPEKVLQNLKISWNDTSLINIGSPVVKGGGSVAYQVQLLDGAQPIVRETTTNIEFYCEVINLAQVISIKVTTVIEENVIKVDSLDPIPGWGGIFYGSVIVTPLLMLITICIIIGVAMTASQRSHDPRTDAHFLHTPPPTYTTHAEDYLSPTKRSPYASPYDTYGTSPRRRPRQQRSPTLWSTKGYDPQEGTLPASPSSG
ncbi:nuclear pore membrane glycoprotein 210-like [Antedon mediterranea]|uniref:nuclear pore membrane glycoprotein 210-like n=1 Tax=Antedon mediterranea TaxID=105859 RepID=UPI003AF4101B